MIFRALASCLVVYTVDCHASHVLKCYGGYDRSGQLPQSCKIDGEKEFSPNDGAAFIEHMNNHIQGRHYRVSVSCSCYYYNADELLLDLSYSAKMRFQAFKAHVRCKELEKALEE